MKNNETTQLLPHNADAYRAVTEAFRFGDRAAVVHATGTGKSYIIERVAKDYGRVAVIAPNNYVLSQLKEHDIRADFLTYPTVHAMRTYSEDRYDLIVLDEFHRAGAECWGRGVDCLLMANPKAKVLGTTATEIRYLDNARNMADELFEGNIVSRLPLTEAWLRCILPVPKYVVGLYNYEDIYSEFMGRLERNHRLEERDKREARDILSRGRLRWENSHGMVSILKKHLPEDTRRIIVFCDRTENLPEVQEKFIQWLAMAGFRAAAYTVHYQNPDSMAEMEDFQKDEENESGVKVLFAIDMLNEGIHVPGVEAVVMLRSTSSKLILLQQMGRCMNAGQKRSPVIFDMVDNLTSTSEVERVRQEYNTLRLEMAVNDTGRTAPEFTIIDEVKDIRDLIYGVNAFRPNRNYEENVELLRYYVMDLGRWPKANAEDTTERSVMSFASIHREDKEVKELRAWAEQHLGIGPWRTKIPFEKSFLELSDFISRERRWPIRGAKDADEKRLYLFCYNNLRSKYTGKLDSFREMVISEYGCDIQFEEGHEKVDIDALAAQLNDFLTANGRWPSYSSKDRNEALLSKRCDRNKNHPAIRAIRERAEKEFGIMFRMKRLPKEESLALVEAFVKENGRWPNRRPGSGKEERYLATVIYTYREDDTLKDIAERYGLTLEYKVSPRYDFDQMYAALEAFVKENHRWPQAGKSGRNPNVEEKRLHVFARRKKDDPRISSLLEWAQTEYGFVYNKVYDTEETLVEVRQFIHDNGRFPSSSAKDEKERTLGSFVTRLKKRSPERLSSFTDEMSPYLERGRRVIGFENRFPELETWVRTNRRWPMYDCENKMEESMAKFASKYANEPKVIALRQEAADTYGHVFRKDSETHFKELVAFVEENGRWPSKTSADKAESGLAVWATQRGRGMLPEFIELRKKAVGMEAERQEALFQDKLLELKAYIHRAGRWPSHHSADPEDHQWGMFVHKYRTHEDIVELKRHFRLNSSAVVQAPFEVRVKELHEFVVRNGRLPLWNATDKNEVDLYHFYISKKNKPRWAAEIAEAIKLD